jgi:hypothetical protein
MKGSESEFAEAKRRVALTLIRPLDPQKLTPFGPAATTAMCHKPTYAVQQNSIGSTCGTVKSFKDVPLLLGVEIRGQTGAQAKGRHPVAVTSGGRDQAWKAWYLCRYL